MKKTNRAARRKPLQPPELLKLDLGCGKNKAAGFIGVDSRAFEGVDQVVDLSARMPPVKNSADPQAPHGGGLKPWPWADGSVGEVNCSHFVEHLKADERIHFVNELYRVLAVGGKAVITTPHWNSHRAYGDLTHQWPPVSEMWFYYVNKGWREGNAPHNDAYTCDFDVTWGYSVRPDLLVKNAEYQQHALSNFKDAAQDMVATFVKNR